MMKANLDLHIHSKYSTATSERMDLPTIAKEAPKKGINVVGTGDCLHPMWMAEVKRLREEDGLFFLDGTAFVLTTEVEDLKRAHHLIIISNISKAQELRDAFFKHSNDLDTNGRPTLKMSPPEIADAVLDAECLIGPAHAFTPWTGMYAHYPSLKDCYGDRVSEIHYLELGLSADSDYADRISELSEKTFLTNSDAHSPWSNKLGREFNQMEMEGLSFEEVKKAILRDNGRKPSLNVGFYPDEGKYNRTACTRCYKHYSPEDLTKMGGRCECGGLIKLGVKGRVDVLADHTEPVHPSHRPPYIHLIPLAEIIAMSLGHKSVYTTGVQKRWSELVKGKSEIEVLLDADISELNAEYKILQAIQAFRSGDVIIKPGGGGKYGEIKLPEYLTHDASKNKKQQTLFDF